MRLHRFWGTFIVSQGKIKIFDHEIINQTRNVLRLKEGDSFILADGKMNEITVRISELKKDLIKAEVIAEEINKRESKIYSILYCSILKRENFEWVCQKATECGIREIVPLVAERTIKLGLKKERLEKIIREAAEQSGRGILPILGNPLKFKDALIRSSENSLNLFFHMDNSLPDRSIIKEAKKAGIFIGPEGGWSEEELELAREKTKIDPMFKFAGLGKTILRGETAAVVASWLVAQ